MDGVHQQVQQSSANRPNRRCIVSRSASFDAVVDFVEPANRPNRRCIVSRSASFDAVVDFVEPESNSSSQSESESNMNVLSQGLLPMSPSESPSASDDEDCSDDGDDYGMEVLNRMRFASESRRVRRSVTAHPSSNADAIRELPKPFRSPLWQRRQQASVM